MIGAPMFQTEPIHALRQLASGVTDLLMVGVTQLGYREVIIPLLIVVLFGVDFRRGFLLVQVAVWNGILTEELKALFALPRPDAVDSTLLPVGGGINPAPFERMGAAGFWEPLPAAVVEHYRAAGDVSYGFPSGHCSGTTALWGTAAILFRRRALTAAAVTLVVLMPLSRMYLGRHFLADVLGGLVLGGLVLAVAWAAVARRPGFAGTLFAGSLEVPPPAARTGVLFLLAAPIAALALPTVDAESAGRLLGLNAAFLLLVQGGLPEDRAPARHRLARVVLAFACYPLLKTALGELAEAVAPAGPWAEPSAGLAEMAGAFLLLWGTTRLAERLGLY